MAFIFRRIIGIEASLKAVEQNGGALCFVKEQTEQICLKAVEQNGYALQFVLEMELFIKIAKKLNIKIDKEEQ